MALSRGCLLQPELVLPNLVSHFSSFAFGCNSSARPIVCFSLLASSPNWNDVDQTQSLVSMLLVYVCSGEGAASSQDARRLLLLDGHRLLPTRRRALTNAPRLVTEVIARTRGFCALQARSSSLRCVAKRLCRSQCKVEIGRASCRERV